MKIFLIELVTVFTFSVDLGYFSPVLKTLNSARQYLTHNCLRPTRLIEARRYRARPLTPESFSMPAAVPEADWKCPR